MIYTMPPEEKAQQLGQLMLDKQASQQRLAQLTLKAKNIGSAFVIAGSTLTNNPTSLIFPHESVDIRFRADVHIDGVIASADDVKTLVKAIREEQIKLWDYEAELKNQGF
jgi:hypothetical protein